MIRKVLSVAEKPSIAKKMAILLSSNFERGFSHSKYNPVFHFNKEFLGEEAEHTVTSVTGHIKNFIFDSNFKDWSSVDPEDLFHAPIYHKPVANKSNLVK
jgi:DNA topoisomerase-3